MRIRIKPAICLLLAGTMGMLFNGCGQDNVADGKVEIEIVQYKPEAAKYFDELEKKFNETHDNIHLTISSPNDAMTILKTRFINTQSSYNFVIFTIIFSTILDLVYRHLQMALFCCILDKLGQLSNFPNVYPLQFFLSHYKVYISSS